MDDEWDCAAGKANISPLYYGAVCDSVCVGSCLMMGNEREKKISLIYLKIFMGYCFILGFIWDDLFHMALSSIFCKAITVL